MIAQLKPYPATRDSGVEWLGQLPAHWEVRRLGQIGCFSKGRGGTKEDEAPHGIPCIRYGDLYTTHQYFIRSNRSFLSNETAKEYTPIKFGDLLFAASGETIDEIGKSAVNLLRCEARCGGDVILFRSHRKIEAGYLGYAMDCRPASIQKATMGRGITIIHIYPDQLKRSGRRAATCIRTDCHRPLPRSRGPPNPTLHPRQKETNHAAGGAEAGDHSPSRHGRDRRPHRPALPGLQGLGRRSGWEECRRLGRFCSCSESLFIDVKGHSNLG